MRPHIQYARRADASGCRRSLACSVTAAARCGRVSAPLRRARSGALCSRRRLHVRASGDADDLHETKLGPNVAAGIKDVKERLTWSSATVIANESVNAVGTHRLLQISVSDEVDLLYGRKIQAVPDAPRWLDSFTVPGQFVGMRFPGEADATASGLRAANRLHSIACSPYQSRADSAYKSGAIIEVVVDKVASDADKQLGEASPGDVLEVSQVIGRGFASLFNSYASLSSSLEEQRNLLVLAVGVRGIASARSALNWAPVLAHASANRVTCYYVTESPQTAAFLPEWDTWREAGIVFTPLYTSSLKGAAERDRNSSTNGNAGSSPGNGSSGATQTEAAAAADGDAAAPAALPSSDISPDVSSADIMGLLESGLFLHEHGLEGAIGCKPADCTVLLAGLSGGVASTVAKELTFKGVSWERLLFADYF